MTHPTVSPTPASDAQAPAADKVGHSYWAFAPVVLLGSLLTGLFVMVRLAVNDPGFAVEPNYYDKAVRWDEQRAQVAHSAELGWHASLTLATPGELSLSLSDGREHPISGAKVKLQAFHNGHAGEVLDLDLAQLAPGSYGAAFNPRRAGLWEFRITAELGSDRWTESLRRDVLLSAR